MIQAQNLPPRKSIRDYPVAFPGQELTEEQEEQANVAQIAGIVLAAAAGKKAIMDATTNQIVALLRVTDLTSQIAVKTFASQAAHLVRLAIRQARNIAWSGVAERAAVVGVDMAPAPPSEEEIPSDLRYSRGTDLETAYTRLAKEYAQQREKGPESPRIAELVRQFEEQRLSPLPRPDNVSSDAIQRVTNGQEDWREAFAKASEEALKDEGRKVTIFETDEEETEAGIRAETARARAEAAEAERESAVATATESDSDAGDGSGRDAGDSGSATGSGDQDSDSSSGSSDSGTGEEEEEEPEFRLTTSEISEIIERHAQQKVEERAERMVSHDVQAASRNMHQVAMRTLPQKKVIGFRRVVHPELSESGQSCGLCIVASTMWYTRRDLLPIHSGCNCETCEIYDLDGVIFDPGEQINMEDLDVFYREAGNSTHGWDLKKSSYRVIDHPEYGPTLTNAKKGSSTENIPFEAREVEDNGTE